jgi:hypothetical protein
MIFYYILLFKTGALKPAQLPISLQHKRKQNRAVEALCKSYRSEPQCSAMNDFFLNIIIE